MSADLGPGQLLPGQGLQLVAVDLVAVRRGGGVGAAAQLDLVASEGSPDARLGHTPGGVSAPTPLASRLVTKYDSASLSAAWNARPDAIPEMVTHALRLLADLLEDTNHICSFTLKDGPFTDNDVAAS